MNCITIRSVVICLLAIIGTRAAAAQDKPNIIVILTDDHGYADVGAQGVRKDVLTPNLDRLAAEGVRATAAYVTAPQCVPSRAGLLSGRYQQKFGVEDNRLGPLPINEQTIAQRLAKEGYLTGMVGKWHLGPTPESELWIAANLPAAAAQTGQRVVIPQELTLKFLPEKRGFAEYFCGELRRYRANFGLDGASVRPSFVEDTRFRVDVQSDAAAAFIDRNRDKPFFLYLAYFAPHVPLEAPEKYLSRVSGDMPVRRRHALAMLSAVDDGVGRILDQLRKYKLDEKTLIFFLSDNGAPTHLDKKEDLPITDRSGVWDGSLNEPWLGEKGMLTEGGIRVPFLVRWTGRIPGGKVYSRPVSSLDIAATAASLAGIEDERLDGVDLIPYLRGEKIGDPHQALYWRFWNQAAARIGKWKYIHLGDGRRFLFNLEADEHEKRNLIEQRPELAKNFEGRLRAWSSQLKPPSIPQGPCRPAENAWYEHYLGSRPVGP